MRKLPLCLCLCSLCFCACQPQTPPPQEKTTAAEEETSSPSYKAAVPIQTYDAFDLDALRAQKPVVVSFMATYCGYCKRLAPYIEALASKYDDGRAQVLIILSEDSPAQARDFARAANIQHAKLIYGGRNLTSKMGVRGFPHTVLFDNTDGQIYRWSGYSPNHTAQIASQIDYILRKDSF